MKTFLLILSGQKHFLSGTSQLLGIEELAKKTRSEDGFVFLDREIRDVEDPFFLNFPDMPLVVGKSGIDFCPSLIPYANTSCTSSTWDRTRLGRVLSEIRKFNPERVVVVGAETQGAVLLTSYGLKVMGVDPIVLEPLCFSSDDYLHAAAISIMADSYKIKVELEL